MLQKWADMVDACINEQIYVPKLLPENLAAPVHVGGGHGWRS